MGDPNTIAFVSGFFALAGAGLLYYSNGISAPVSLALGIVGTICAWIGRQRVKRGETTNNAMWADVGLAVGGLTAGLSLIVTIILAIVVLTD